MFSKIVVPPNHPLKNRLFHDFHHPFGGYPYFWKHPSYISYISYHIISYHIIFPASKTNAHPPRSPPDPPWQGPDLRHCEQHLKERNPPIWNPDLKNSSRSNETWTPQICFVWFCCFFVGTSMFFHVCVFECLGGLRCFFWGEDCSVCFFFCSCCFLFCLFLGGFFLFGGKTVIVAFGLMFTSWQNLKGVFVVSI